MKSNALLLAICCWAFVGGSNDRCDHSYPEESSAAEDGRLNMFGLASKYKYPMEVYDVQTEDGYVLKMYRIPNGKMCKSNKPKIPVLLQHGMLSSSYDYLITGPKKALGYLLADACYDVWLGNNRGNGESKRHVSLKPEQKEFWSFSWHEMGKYDLPAMIDLILNVTGQPKLHYVGHSQGTTQFFVFGSLRPEYHSKIRSMHALSPVAYMKHLSSPVFRFLNLFYTNLKQFVEMLGLYELFPSQSLLNFLGQEMCKNEYPTLQGVCCNVLFLLCGFDEPQLNKTMLPAIIGHTPAGSGVRQIIHYAQGIRSGKFRQISFGLKNNLKIYNSTTPPSYKVEKINIPIAFYYGANDYLSDVEDVKKLKKQIPNLIEDYLVPFSKFSHLDFLYAIDVNLLVYDRLLEVMKKY